MKKKEVIVLVLILVVLAVPIYAISGPKKVSEDGQLQEVSIHEPAQYDYVPTREEIKIKWMIWILIILAIIILFMIAIRPLIKRFSSTEPKSQKKSEPEQKKIQKPAPPPLPSKPVIRKTKLQKVDDEIGQIKQRIKKMGF